MAAKNKLFYFAVILPVFLFSVAMKADEQPSIPAGSKVYVAPMDGFETYLKAALKSKKVPLEVVDNKQNAAYEITQSSSRFAAMRARKSSRASPCLVILSIHRLSLQCSVR